MEWSIQHAARLAGTTSRALRHYDELGVVPPSRVGRNGYRYYDERALVRLQRVLLLRGLGLGLAQIAGVLADEDDEVSALTTICHSSGRSRTGSPGRSPRSSTPSPH